jgi:PQQ-dependent catabolism-associated CXXCW motif protein
MRNSAKACAVAMLLACGLAHADEDADFGGEDADFGVAPTRELRLADYAAPTPREVPGARVIRTPQLQAWLQRDASARPLLLDVVGGEGHDSIPGAIWLPGAGRGRDFDDAVQARLAGALAALTGRASTRSIVFFCASTKCWLSYNAALRAATLGYTEVYWYRGGIEAWLDAGGDLSPMSKIKYIM